MLFFVFHVGWLLFALGATAEPGGLLAVSRPTLAEAKPAPLPAGPLPALAMALKRPIGTPPFPYGRQFSGTQALYFLLRAHDRVAVKSLCDTLHREPVWLRRLTDEVRGQGFD